jgi:hypothetical protein
VKDPTSLIPFQGAIRIKLVLEDPFTGDDVGANKTRDKIPSVVVIRASYSSYMA